MPALKAQTPRFLISRYNFGILNAKYFMPKSCILNAKMGFFCVNKLIVSTLNKYHLQWGSEIRPFENRNHLKTEHFCKTKAFKNRTFCPPFCPKPFENRTKCLVFEWSKNKMATILVQANDQAAILLLDHLKTRPFDIRTCPVFGSPLSVLVSKETKNVFKAVVD